MGTQERQSNKGAADFEKDVSLASQRSSSQDGRHLKVLEGVIGEPWMATYPEDEGQKSHQDDQISAAEWIEMQLLECQNLARQEGFLQLASHLDMALDIMAGGSSEKLVSSSNGVRGLVLPFPCR